MKLLKFQISYKYNIFNHSNIFLKYFSRKINKQSKSLLTSDKKSKEEDSVNTVKEISLSIFANQTIEDVDLSDNQSIKKIRETLLNNAKIEEIKQKTLERIQNESFDERIDRKNEYIENKFDETLNVISDTHKMNSNNKNISNKQSKKEIKSNSKNSISPIPYSEFIKKQEVLEEGDHMNRIINIKEEKKTINKNKIDNDSSAKNISNKGLLKDITNSNFGDNYNYESVDKLLNYSNISDVIKNEKSIYKPQKLDENLPDNIKIKKTILDLKKNVEISEKEEEQKVMKFKNIGDKDSYGEIIDFKEKINNQELNRRVNKMKGINEPLKNLIDPEIDDKKKRCK